MKVAGLLGFLLLLLFVPLGPETINYRSVVEQEDSVSTNMISSTNLKVVENSDYVIYNNKLYLKVQSTQSTLLLITYVNKYPWNIQKLSENLTVM